MFDDPFALDMDDEDHSDEENRFIKLGEAVTRQLLVVAYTQRGDNVRIISARYATPRERRNYAEGT